MNRCIHGTELDWCSLCNGTTTRIEDERKKWKRYHSNDSEYIRVREYYEERSETFSNSNRDWGWDEIDKLYVDLVERVWTKSARRTHIYEIALALERTIKSVVWHYKMLKYPERDMHRGKRLINYMKEKGIPTYNGV
jgi:hypothetical protein